MAFMYSKANLYYLSTAILLFSTQLLFPLPANNNPVNRAPSPATSVPQQNNIMYKQIIVIVSMAAMLAVSHAAIKQDGLFNCGGAQQLGKPESNNCCQLCWCLGAQSGNTAFKSPQIQSFCKQQCNKCVVAAHDGKQCPNSNSVLPTACSQGLAFNAQVKSVVNKCVDMYQKDPASLRKSAGC